MSEWELVRLGEMFEFIRNGVSIKQDSNLGFPITRIETISDGTVNRNKLGYAGITDLSKFKKYVLENRDILMSHINSEKHLGKTALYIKNNSEETIIHGMNLLCLRSFETILVPSYANFFFRTVAFKNQISRITKNSVNQSSFTVTALKDIQIPLPPIATQQKIANILGKASELIEKRKMQITKLDLLTKAKFIDMFGDPVSNPMGWEVGTIRDLAKEVKYGTSKPADANGSYIYLRMNNITYDGHIDLSNIKYINVADGEKEKYMVYRGDLLFNRTNSKELVGKTAVFKEDIPMIIAGYIIRLRTNHRANSDYISAFLNSSYGKKVLFEMCKAIVGQANINAQELQDIKIQIPPINLQITFANFLESVEAQKALLQTGLDKLELNYKSLMQNCFNGTIFK